MQNKSENVNQTVKLLRECNSGIKMGVDSINQVLPHVKNEEFKNMLISCKELHQKLGSRTHELLNQHENPIKSPPLMAKSMSWIKTNAALAFSENENTAASILTDGCNMGVKSLNRYLNEYPGADQKAVDIAKELIDCEKNLCRDMQRFL